MGVTLQQQQHHCKEMDIRSGWKINILDMYNDFKEHSFVIYCLWCGAKLE
jgi:hypothetical protein